MRRNMVAALALVSLAAACGEKESDVQTLELGAAEQIVAAYAQATLDSSGQGSFSQSSLTPGPCEGRQGEFSDTVYTMQGAYQLLVAAADQPALLDRVRDAWAAHGYTITSQRSFPSGGGEVNATNPADGVVMTLATGEPPAMLLLINTGCYVRPA